MRNAILSRKKYYQEYYDIMSDIENTDGVISVESLIYSLDEENKKLSYTCQIRTIYGETELNGVI